MLATTNLAKAYNNCTDLNERFNNLYYFYEKAVASKYNNFSKSWHLEKLANELTNLTNGEFNNLCIAMPPRHSKSSMVTLAYPLWLIMNNPQLNILIINAEQSLSEKFGIDLKDILGSLGCLKDIYLSDVKHSNTHFKFEDSYGNLYRGGVKLVGLNGNYTGHDADYIIIDDPYKGFEDITPTLLEKKIDLFKTKILQRREPHTKLIICHTKWHTNDLQGYLKENSPEDYKFLEFPAILPNGEPLWKNRFDIDFLQHQLKEMGERLFSSIYQQQPLDETGDYFNIERLQFIDHFQTIHNPIVDGVVRSYDCAYSDESKGNVNDRTASVKMYHTINDHYIITEVTAGRYGEQLFNKIKGTARVDTPNVPIVIETGTVGGASKYLFEVYKKDLMGYNVTQGLPLTSKVDRAFALKEAILDGKVFVCLDDNARGLLLEEMKGFPLMKHDDIVDATSQAFNYLNSKSECVVGTSSGRERVRL